VAGLFHINAVDTVTQWQVIGCVETICERHLVPVLEAMLHQFPFRLLGFHCDNGSEFLNHRVSQMLNKLLVEFTKSRAYRTTDNALVEGKNGAVIRKQMGYGPIAAEHADAFQRFYTAWMNPYLNFHRPCGFATIRTDARGKHQRRYPHQDYQTPFEKLTSLGNWQQYLKPGVSQADLQRRAGQLSDTEAARQMQKNQAGITQALSRKRMTTERCGNDGSLESVENQTPVSQAFHQLLGNRLPAISTFPQRRPRFPLSRTSNNETCSRLRRSHQHKKGTNLPRQRTQPSIVVQARLALE